MKASLWSRVRVGGFQLGYNQCPADLTHRIGGYCSFFGPLEFSGRLIEFLSIGPDPLDYFSCLLAVETMFSCQVLDIIISGYAAAVRLIDFRFGHQDLLNF